DWLRVDKPCAVQLRFDKFHRCSAVDRHYSRTGVDVGSPILRRILSLASCTRERSCDQGGGRVRSRFTGGAARATVPLSCRSWPPRSARLHRVAASQAGEPRPPYSLSPI